MRGWSHEEMRTCPSAHKNAQRWLYTRHDYACIHALRACTMLECSVKYEHRLESGTMRLCNFCLRAQTLQDQWGICNRTALLQHIRDLKHARFVPHFSLHFLSKKIPKSTGWLQIDRYLTFCCIGQGIHFLLGRACITLNCTLAILSLTGELPCKHSMCSASCLHWETTPRARCCKHRDRKKTCFVE